MHQRPAVSQLGFANALAANADGNFLFNRTGGAGGGTDTAIFSPAAVPVTPGTNYVVSIDLGNEVTQSSGPFKIYVNDVLIATIAAAEVPIQDFATFSFNVNSGVNTTLAFRMEGSTATSGNDFGIDNFSVAPVLPVISNTAIATIAGDRDSDGVIDSIDIDDDNDGIVDDKESSFTSGQVELSGQYIRSIDITGAEFPNLYPQAPLPDVWFDGATGEGVSTFAPIGIKSNDFSANPVTITAHLIRPQSASGFILANDYGVVGDGIKDATVLIYDLNGVLIGTEPFTSLSSDSTAVQKYTFTQTYHNVGSFSFVITSTWAGGGTPNNEMQIREIGLFSNVGAYTDVDTDGDGVLDSLDLDSDNDGISDLVESGAAAAKVALDVNHDGTVSLTESVDVDADGLMDTFDVDTSSATKTSSTSSIGTIPLNTDGDAVANWRDLDSDNDSIPDTVETRSTASYVANDGNVTNNDADKGHC